MDAVSKIALMMGVGWASGINLYAAVFMLGFMGANGYITLPPDLQFLTDPMVMLVAGVMYCVEFFADKTPGVDTGWDTLHSFIRIPAGAVLAMRAMGDVGPAAELAAFMVGGSLATMSHVTKAGSRVLINTSPEPLTNWTASIIEDVAVIIGLWAALNHPVGFLVALALFVAFGVWLLPKLWRGIKAIAARVGTFLRGSPPAAPSSAPLPTPTPLPKP
ncbi:MAG: DUF4126 domain-containing protein [Chromatiales bacterium]